MTTVQEAVPALEIPAPLETIHRSDSELPWVQLTPEVETKVSHVNLRDGLWVVRNRMQPGCEVQTHRHTGSVFAFTLSGSWHYLESADQVNGPGSYLFEPAGSTHTLKVLDDSDGPADVWFAIYGANLNLDKDGNIESVLDAGTMYAVYKLLCETQGFGTPPVVLER